MKIFQLIVPLTAIVEIHAENYSQAERLARRGEGLTLGTRFGCPLTARGNLSPKARLLSVRDVSSPQRMVRPDDWPDTSAKDF